ncbi:endothelin-3b [Nelusetta ayraudi]|uniref:endothelin-3b n=1 Tax=Nelusetta ayraudi TaxID=303726 RepID=UPI003F7015F4
MARILSVMLFNVLGLLLLQGVLSALLAPEFNPRGLPGPRRVSGPGGPAGSQMSGATEAKSRPKRCTCYSYKDKECVYYCHLDIIWINTPERTVPYGMSSYRGPQRVRRAAPGKALQHQVEETQRCVCAVPDADSGCHTFCHSSPLQAVPLRRLRRVTGPG